MYHPANQLDLAADSAETVRQLLQNYDAPLLKTIAAELLQSRIQRKPEEIRERVLDLVGDAAAVDRQMKELPAQARQLLALVGMSAQPVWRLRDLVAMLNYGKETGSVDEILVLLRKGLIYPWQNGKAEKVKRFEEWLFHEGLESPELYVPPEVSHRAIALRHQLPPLSPGTTQVHDLKEGDGLEWLLRVAATWQMVRTGPLRITQQGEYFKKDNERLAENTLVSGSPQDEIQHLPDAGRLFVDLGLRLGLFKLDDGSIVAQPWPARWPVDLGGQLKAFWSIWHKLDSWNPAAGWRGPSAAPSGEGTLALFTLAILAQQPNEEWTRPEVVGTWLEQNHPWLREQQRSELALGWAQAFLLGVAYQMRWIQVARDEEQHWVVRLSGHGRAILGLGDAPKPTSFSQTLLVQPNLEVLAYRQGLNPTLVRNLSQFATWQSIGSACTLKLSSEGTYAGLEAGLSLQTIEQTLQQHVVREVPINVMQSLRTWANKRERITVYTAATLLEFPTTEDLQSAIARGLPATPIAERLALVAQEGDISYQHLRLMGTRDYGLPPDQCVTVAEDGVTLTVDLARSDLLLETELRRFAVPETMVTSSGQRTYQLTPQSLTQGRNAGLSLRALDEWFLQRTGAGLPAAVRLLYGGSEPTTLPLREMLVLETATLLQADGLMQWPATRELIQARLGGTALAVARENVDKLTAVLQGLGITVSK